MRKALTYTGWMLAAALLYLGWVMAERYLANRDAERAAQARLARSGRLEPEETGVQIAQFYAAAGEVSRGESTLICYGVRNARAVRLDPPVAEVFPSFNRCFEFTPSHQTTLTLTAEGADGKQVSVSFTIKVKPPAPKILFVSVSHGEIRRGEPVTVCYGVSNATVRLEPGGPPTPSGEKNCVRFFPPRTTRYTLLATGVDGRTDRESFTLKVR